MGGGQFTCGNLRLTYDNNDYSGNADYDGFFGRLGCREFDETEHCDDDTDCPCRNTYRA